MKNYDVCIIGGGASGLAAAASLDDGINACLLEKNSTPGKKVSASGGGRCNITNRAAPGAEETVEFFRGIGLELYCDEEGRYYPYSNQASDVTEALLQSIKNKNTQIYTEFPVRSISTEGGKFFVYGDEGAVCADNLIIAAGGKSYPQLGTTGDGYAMARSLGHAVRRVYPVLTPVECYDMPDFRGIRCRGRVTLYKDGIKVCSEAGEIQFTADGISGICVFNITMGIRAEDGEKLEAAMRRYEISIDFAPDFSEDEILSRKSSFGIVTGRIAEEVTPEHLKDYRLKVKGTKGWKQAQCTAGGVDLSDLDAETMESGILPGLYFAGEVLDIQFKCGGFNLQNAWQTGRKAAAAINRKYR